MRMTYLSAPGGIPMVLAAGLALAAAATPALAESRLFSIQTDRPGLTVTGAARNGAPLAVAGIDGATTFFRIDNPSGAVPCTASLAITLSDGATVNRNVDFCATDWDVTLAMLAQPPAAVPGPASSYGDLTVTSDDPSGEIVNVYAGGEPVSVVGFYGTSAIISLQPGQGGDACTRDIGLEFADGRRIARMVDICAGDGTIVVPVIADVTPPANQPQYQAQQPQTQPQPQYQPAPAATAGMSWFTARDGGQAQLVFGIPQTDASEFNAVCDIGSGQTTVVLSRGAPGLAPGGSVGVHFQAGGFNAVYNAVGTRVSELTGLSHPRIDLDTGDALWPALIRENELVIQIGQGAPFALSLKGSAVKAREFLALCNPAPAAPPPQQQAAPGQVAFVCQDGSTLSVAFGGGTATVFEGPFPAILLQSAPAQSGVRFVGPEGELTGLDEQITWRRAGAPTRVCTPN